MLNQPLTAIVNWIVEDRPSVGVCGISHGPSPYTNSNQRIKTTLADGSYWVYTYDFLGQVISGNRYWADNTPVAGQQNQYNFDDIGNRTMANSMRCCGPTAVLATALINRFSPSHV